MVRSEPRSLKHEILAGLDIEAEYQAMGLRLAGRNAGGWTDAHAAGREDSSPSGAINVADPNFERGWYRDRGTGESLSFFDFAVKYGSISGVVDFNSALAYFRKRAGLCDRTKPGGGKGGGRSFPKPTVPINPVRAEPDDLHDVYSQLLKRSSPLNRGHMDKLRKRGLTTSDLISFSRPDGKFTDSLMLRGYRSFPSFDDKYSKSRAAICSELIAAGLEEKMSRTPGFVWERKDGLFWTISAHPGIAIPIRNSHQRIVAITVRQDDESRGKYKLLSSRRRVSPSGASPGTPIHHARPHLSNDTSRVIICEGPLKADVTAMRLNVAAIGLPGHDIGKNLSADLQRTFSSWGVKEICLAPDADFRNNADVALSLCKLVDFVQSLAIQLEVWEWTPEQKGIDELLLLEPEWESRLVKHTGPDDIERFLKPVREFAKTGPKAKSGSRKDRKPVSLSIAASSPPSSSAIPANAVPEVPRLDTVDGRTDLANARRFVAANRDQARFCHSWNKWLVWDGKRWKVDEDGAVMRLAKMVADVLWKEVIKFPGDPSVVSWAFRTSSKTGLTAMVELAKSDLPICVDELDADPWHLNCVNGTIDLRTGRLREHRREDYITKLCPEEFIPDSPAPIWEQFLQDVFDRDAELIAFVQRLLGYGLTGDIREHVLTVFWGTGANGKSTLVDAVSQVIGSDYCGALPRSLLMATGGEASRHPTELTTLFGKRLMIGSETDDGGRFSEALVKQLTGGDAITARGMRQDFWTFRPTHKIILCTNHKPRVRGGDHAIWRRLRLVPFSVRFDAEHRDKSMPEKLQSESTGILAWLVRGCLEWQRVGLNEPSVIQEATDEYQQAEDSLASFFEERCCQGGQLKCRALELYQEYKNWAEESGEHVMTQRSFGKGMTERGFKKYVSNGTWYAGIAIRNVQSIEINSPDLYDDSH